MYSYLSALVERSNQQYDKQGYSSPVFDMGVFVGLDDGGVIDRGDQDCIFLNLLLVDGPVLPLDHCTDSLCAINHLKGINQCQGIGYKGGIVIPGLNRVFSIECIHRQAPQSCGTFKMLLAPALS